MQYIHVKSPIKIIGVEIKTTNDNERAFKDIPPQWQKFFQEALFEKIPNKISKDIYAIYTNFENEGKNNQGMYSFIIGAEVKSFDEIPKGFTSVLIPTSEYQVFDVATPEKVGEKWKEIWKYSFQKNRTYKLDFERYSENGKIEIFVGVK